jgi:nicotinate phosphoribosyltransferase
MAYKLVEYDGRSTLKLSADKVTSPGAKQVYRAPGPDGLFERDIIALRGEAPPPGAEPLLGQVMKHGRRVREETLDEARKRLAASMDKLADGVTRIADPEEYAVVESEGLKQETTLATRRAKEQIESE